MSSIERTHSQPLVIGDRPVLRLADLVKEAESMPAEITDFGNGVVIERHGPMFKMTGTSPLSIRATIAAFEATRMGGKAGQAMFDTYRKTNADQFDPSRSWNLNPNGMSPAAPSPFQGDSPSGKVTRVAEGGTFKADPEGGAVNVEGGKSVTVSGSAEDDFLLALYGSTLFGLAGNDRLSAEDAAVLDGGDGDDLLSAYGDSTLLGGAGNDRMSAYEHSFLDGGDGDDLLSAYGNSTLLGGAGNDRIDTYSDSVVEAGDGYNYITAGERTSITAGSGDDMILAADGSVVNSGAGDDLIKVGRGSVVTAGLGDDRLMVEDGSTIYFNQGDGNDSIGGGEWGKAYTATERLSSSLLSFGAGITPADLTMQRQGNDLLISVGGGDSVTLKDVQRHGIPNMTFTDGTVLTSDYVEDMVGPAEPYKPASQVMQRWYDANAAYNAKLSSNSTAGAEV